MKENSLLKKRITRRSKLPRNPRTKKNPLPIKLLEGALEVRDRVASTGLAALDTQLEFDEREVLEANTDYIVNAALQLDGMEVKFSSEAGSDKMAEECRPGAPYITFRREPGVPLSLVNDQPHSGAFTATVSILAGDDAGKVARRLARMEKAVKDPAAVRLYRWEDPVLGPRRMPNMQKPMDGKVEVKEGDKFEVDLEKGEVKVGGVDVGQSMVYRF